MNPAIGHEDRHLYEFGAFRLDADERVLTRQGERVSLPPKAFDTLLILVRHSRHVLSKEHLIKTLWPDSFVEENNLTQQISVLRKTLAANGRIPTEQEYIETVPKLGYRFMAEVREIGNGDWPGGAEAGTWAEAGAAETEAPEGEVVWSKRARTHIVLRETEEIEEDEVDLVEAAISERKNESLATLAASKLGRTWTGWATTGVAVAGVCVAVAVATYLWSRPMRPTEGLNYSVLSSNVDAGRLLAADDKYVYFSGREGNELWKVATTGGDPVLVSAALPGADPKIMDYLPARGEMLVARGSLTNTEAEPELWEAAASGNSHWRVGDLYAHDAAWSPDAESIVYGYQDSLYAARRDGSGQRLLARVPGKAYAPTWSPDNEWIRFEVWQGGAISLWEVRPDGSGLRSILTESVALPHRGQWTSDGAYFLLPLNRSGRTDLWALPRTRDPLAHLEPIRLTNGLVDLTFPVPSKDGKAMFAAGRLLRVEIVRHDAAKDVWAPFLAGVSADSLAFSNDGQWVAYSLVPERTLWRSRVDGSERIQLTFATMESLLPRWSPDGKTIAFMARAPGEPWQIRTIAAQGGPSEALVAGPDNQATPGWSRDGKLLTYAGAPWLHGFEANSTAIHCFDLRTHQVTTLPKSLGLWSPRWSPDGRYVVAETADSHGLRLFDVRKQSWEPLADVSGEVVGYSAWSRDSRYLYFNSRGQGSARIYRVDVRRERRVREVVDLGTSSAETLGEWFTLAPDDSPLVLRDTSIRNLYELELRLP